MKLEIKRMYDAIKAIEAEELKKKLNAVGGSYEFAEDERPCLDVWNPESGGETIGVYINSVSITAIDTLDFNAEIDGSNETLALNANDFMYEGLSYIADEIKYPRGVWARVGCFIYGTKEQMDYIMGVEGAEKGIELKDMFNNGQVEWSGCSYIPQDCIESYNEEYGEDIEVGDIDLD